MFLRQKPQFTCAVLYLLTSIESLIVWDTKSVRRRHKYISSKQIKILSMLVSMEYLNRKVCFGDTFSQILGHGLQRLISLTKSTSLLSRDVADKVCRAWTWSSSSSCQRPFQSRCRPDVANIEAPWPVPRYYSRCPLQALAPAPLSYTTASRNLLNI